VNLFVSSVIRYMLAAAALAAAYYSALFARASFLFERDTADSVAAAVQLVPYNATYVARLSAWQPERKIALFRRAVKLNPFEVDAWIQLGVAAEMEQRDIASAERYYLEAARIDHMFLPKWTLTNFYFRRQREDEFFHWAKAALEISPYQPDPVFGQMWLMTQDARRVAMAVPDRPGVLLRYAGFLANARQYTAIPPILHRLVAAAGRANPGSYGRDDQVGPIVDRLLAAGEIDSALEIWRSLEQGNWVNFPAPSFAAPLSNGDFHSPFFRHGFDWMPASLDGVDIVQIPEGKNVRVAFSGNQPEHCVLLQQYIPLEANRGYRLRWKADGQGIEMPSGLAWHVHPVSDERRIDLAGGDLLAGSQGTWQFSVPAGANLSLLTLEYSRPAGSVRIAGVLTLQGVSLSR
jgi:hypothetical protein